MSNVPFDPLKALAAALAAPADTKEQAEQLEALREHLEAHPNPIPVLCTTLIGVVSGGGDSALKRWVLDLLHFAICRSTLPAETKTQRVFHFWLCVLRERLTTYIHVTSGSTVVGGFSRDS